MAIPDAQTAAEKWANRTGAAGQDYLAGVMQTDKDPTALAIQNQGRLVANFNAAVQNGTWANALRARGKAGWQQAVADKGVTNFQTGVAAAKDRVAQAFGPLLAYEAGLQRTINGLPNVTDADREARMLAWVRGMRQYRAQ